MAGEAQAERWVAELGIAGSVSLLPRLPLAQMADLFREAQVVVSPTTHDGTPNSLLEAMACGCFPVAGDIESLREWITPGVNGVLAVPDDPRALAGAIVQALENPAMRASAAVYNQRMVAERAEYGQGMRRAEKFYQELIR
jgi:glycosyltransferase involved in cell wall biosynthesis